ncbi:unnamed protein product [Ranitomeya imitator]|uniref:ribonuclease H n=1 Tax=Ranitomeya imitator TaxID=111125 RepID=A0ABN9LJI7_9NEOB|nr:unnamed protein product [Ranitomeya imitator]
MKTISQEKRNRIIQLINSSLSAKKIAKLHHVSAMTVARIRNKVRPSIKKPKGGHPDKILASTSRPIPRSISSGVTNTAVEVAHMLHNTKGVGSLTRIDSGLNDELYVSILQDELLCTLKYYGYEKDDMMFQQDNNMNHISKLANKWFNDNELEVLEWPPQSPDLNPIKYLWVELKKKVYTYPINKNSKYFINDGATPLFLAAQGGFVDVVRLLLTYGAKANQPRQDGTTALWIAAQLGYSEVVRVLLLRGADRDALRTDGTSALFKAAAKGFNDVIEELLKFSPTLGVLKNGSTALHAAVLGGNLKSISLLLEAGANPAIRNKCCNVQPRRAVRVRNPCCVYYSPAPSSQQRQAMLAILIVVLLAGSSGTQRERLRIYPITLRGIDATPLAKNKPQYWTQLTMCMAPAHQEDIRFLVLHNLHDVVVLRLPWLQVHNPVLDWKSMSVSSWGCQGVHGDVPFLSISSSTPSEVPEFLSDYRDVFDEPKSSALPLHRDCDCAINLIPGSKFPKGRLFNLSVPEHAAMRSYVKESLEKGHIRPSSSPLGAGFFFVAKKDGSLRPCIDYRLLNKITVKFQYPLPLLLDLFARIKGASWFTKIDLRGAYNLVRIKQGDEWKTAFNTPEGHFEYLVMPFGLSNAPSVFQSFMHDIFREYLDKFLIVYLDDILVFSDDWESHVKQVEVDASEIGAGAVLSQRSSDGSVMKPCAFFSRKFSPAERNYDVGNRELLAMKWAFEEWRHWLEGAKHRVVFLTDHKNLTYLESAKQLNPRQARWSLFFSRFDFVVSYLPGSKNVKADTLSRSFVPDSPGVPEPAASFAIHNVFHRSLLRRYVAPVVPSVDPPAPVLVEGELEYVVEKILDSRISRQKLQYLVKWKGYGQEDNSWVFASDVHAADLVRAFHLAHPGRTGGSACYFDLCLACWKLWDAEGAPLYRESMDNDPKHKAKATQEFIKAKKWNIFEWPSQSSDLNPIEHAFHLLKTKLQTERPTNKQQLKTTTVKAWQSIKKEETQRLPSRGWKKLSCWFGQMEKTGKMNDSIRKKERQRPMNSQQISPKMNEYYVY